MSSYNYLNRKDWIERKKNDQNSHGSMELMRLSKSVERNLKEKRWQISKYIDMVQTRTHHKDRKVRNSIVNANHLC